MMVLNAAWSLTAGGVSGPGLLIEPSCWGTADTGVIAEMGAKVGGGEGGSL